jgi:aspartate racemase
MRTIGLLGGMSWESSLHYYRLINEEVRRRLGDLHSAQLLMYSIDFQAIERMQAEGRWADAGNLLGEGAARLERGGADFVVLCTNTMHRVAAAIEARVRIPLLHIADVTGAEIQRRGLVRVGLLGTRFTMEQPFYRDRLTELFQLEVITPSEPDRHHVHAVIYKELCFGRIVDASRGTFQRISAALAAEGAQGLIFGCTEITMLLGQDDVSLPVFDTTRLHAIAAVDRALAPS